MIELRPSSIRVYGISEESPGFEKLAKSLSVWDPIYFKNKYTALHKSPSSKYFVLPRGYSVKRLQGIFPGMEVRDSTRRVAIEPREVSFSVRGSPRPGVQEDAVSFLMGNEGRFHYSKGRPMRFLTMATGKGKTFLAIYFAHLYGAATLVVVDQIPLLNQWVEEELLRLTDLEREDVAVVVGSKSIERLMGSEPSHKVYVASSRTLQAYFSDKPKLLNRMMSHLGIGLKVFDECHVEWANQVFINCFSDVGLTISMTATPNRSNRFEDRVYRRLLDDVPKFGAAEKSREEAYHDVLYVSIDSCPGVAVDAALSTGNRYGFDKNGYCEYLLESKYDYFYSALKRVVGIAFGKSFSKIRRAAVLLGTLGLVERVAKDLAVDFPDLKIGEFTSAVKDKKEKERNLKECNILVTTEKSFSQMRGTPKTTVGATSARFCITVSTFSMKLTV